MRRPTQPHELLEQELNILLGGVDAEEYGDGQSEDVKKRVRTIKNRLAAKKSREQARSYVQELESNLSRMRMQNEDLARRLALAEAENGLLKRGLKIPLCSNTAAPNGKQNCGGEPAAGRSSVHPDGGVITGVRKPQSNVSKPKLLRTCADSGSVSDAIGREKVVPEPSTSGAAPVYFPHLPQYTSVTSACKKRKLSSSVGAAPCSPKKMPKEPTPEARGSISLNAKITATLKNTRSIDEPPRLVESPTSNCASSPFSEGEDADWLDDVNAGDPGAMLEQLMKDEPASPLQETGGIFNASAWCN